MAHVSFDTVAHRDTAQAAVVARGSTATPGLDPQGRPTLTVDFNVALDQIKAQNIRNAIRTAKASGWIVGGEFSLHRCTHDEGPDAWQDCKTLTFEVN